MAKLSDRQKNNIKAKWNTGEYTKTQLAKTYKVNEKIIRNIVGKEEPTNNHIVEAQMMLEKFKKSEKSPNEISAINQAVEYRLQKEFSDDNNKIKVFETTSAIIDGVKKLIKDGKAQKATTANIGDGIIEANIIETDLQASDYKNAMDTIDKASITLGVNQRHANQQINVNTQNNNQNSIINQEIVSQSLEAFDNEY